MRDWWDRRPETLKALGRMTGYVAYAVTFGLLARWHAGWVAGLFLAVTGVVQRLNAGDLTTRAGQRLLLAEAYETMRIPPRANRALWREWLEPREVTALSRRWDRAEALVGGGSLGLGAVIAFDVTTPRLVALIIALSLIAGIAFDAWSSRRPKPRSGYPSDRAYLLAQLEALESRRDS